MTEPWEHAATLLLAPARDAEPTEDEVRRVLDDDAARDRRGRARRRRRVTATIGALALVCCGAVAVPATRAAVSDVFESLADWVRGDEGQVPGRPLGPSDDPPPWVRQAPGEKRVLATAGGVQMIAVRESSDQLSIALGASVGQSASVEDCANDSTTAR